MRITQNTKELAVTKLFVTVTLVDVAAKLTVPVGLLIVWLPVVPDAVLVKSVVNFELKTGEAVKVCANGHVFAVAKVALPATVLFAVTIAAKSDIVEANCVPV